ncbi:MAG TPA: Uma2 family endonuclease [Longimicrobiales bacterium]
MRSSYGCARGPRACRSPRLGRGSPALSQEESARLARPVGGGASAARTTADCGPPSEDDTTAYGAQPDPRLPSLEAYERLPEEEGTRIELVRGRLVREPAPGMRHAWQCGRIVGRISRYLDEEALGLVLTEMGFILARNPPTVRIPDIAFIAEANLPPEGISAGFGRRAPDLAVEIVSPANATTEMREKAIEYLAAGARAVRVIHPRRREVAACRPGAAVRILTDADVLDGGDVLPGLRTPLEELFWR